MNNYRNNIINSQLYFTLASVYYYYNKTPETDINNQKEAMFIYLLGLYYFCAAFSNFSEKPNINFIKEPIKFVIDDVD